MSSANATRCLALDLDHPNGIVDLPDCDLVIKYGNKGEAITSPDEAELGKQAISRKQRETESFPNPLSVVETAPEPLRILHLSDLHMKPDTDPESMLQPLIADLRDPEGGLGGIERLDYLVMSGDLSNRAKIEEFAKARQFISGLMERFEVTADRCIIVPGNHDLDRDEAVYDWKERHLVDVTELKAGSYVEQELGFLIRNEQRYLLRFKNFSENLYNPLVQHPYPLVFKDQCIPFLFSDARIQFLAMNSCWEIDKYFEDRSSIDTVALSRGLTRADKQIKQARADAQLSDDASVLRIAVWHHPVTGNDKIVEDAFIERLQQVGFRLCLHGHVHEERTDLIGYLHPTRRLYVAGAGSFDAPVCARPESIPRLYNVLEVASNHSIIRVHTRCLRKPTGAWEGWAVWPGKSSHERQTYYDIHLPIPEPFKWQRGPKPDEYNA